MTPLAKQIEAHALGIATEESPQDTLDRFNSIDRGRLIERHAAEVQEMRDRLDKIKAESARRGIRIDRLWLVIAGLGMACLYLFLRDAKCPAPWWP